MRSWVAQPPQGKPASSAASSAPRSTPVWPPEMIFFRDTSVNRLDAVFLDGLRPARRDSRRGNALRAAAVVDDDLLAERLLQRGLYGARDRIGAAAGREGDYEPDRALGIAVGGVGRR